VLVIVPFHLLFYYFIILSLISVSVLLCGCYACVSVFLCFYRAMLRRARYCHSKLSVRLSVRLSACDVEVYRGQIGWNTWKIISRLINLTFPLSADPNITDLLQKEHPKF